ncbi:MAG TPA: hypothetical protein VGR06_24275 [Actinophytocola sp.]|uniref:hypothetical protein n=1 Tax=Actinophytocola sp. TaxID=1872138 RepID=UPI002E07F190|nr:hypothetical protein [Actinophytocola sp.]
MGRGLSGWVPRIMVAAAAGGIVAVLMANGIGGAALALVVLAVVLSVAMPSSPAPTLVLVLVGLSVLVLGRDPLAGPVLALIPLVHLFHVSCAIAGTLPAKSRVHLSALRTPALRFVAIQAGVLALAGLLALVRVDHVTAPLEILALAGLAAVAFLMIWLIYRA